MLGDPRGQSPLASLAEAEKPKGFFGEAVRCGLPQCETCLTTSPRFRSLGGRGGVVSGFFAFGRRVTKLFNGFSLVEKALNDVVS